MRRLEEGTTNLDLNRWHRVDRPECDEPPWWQIGPPGIRCLRCGWEVLA